MGPAQWHDGGNIVSVDVDVGRWKSGTAEFAVPWPLTPATGLLASVQEAMGARSALDTVETVTSGLGTPAGAPPRGPWLRPHRQQDDHAQFEMIREPQVSACVVMGTGGE